MNANQIKDILEKKFQTNFLEVTDHSFRHRNHQEAKAHGGGHFKVVMVSDDFVDLGSVQRHQLIYQALSMPRAEIHAMEIIAKTIKEYQG